MPSGRIADPSQRFQNLMRLSALDLFSHFRHSFTIKFPTGLMTLQAPTVTATRSSIIFDRGNSADFGAFLTEKYAMIL